MKQKGITWDGVMDLALQVPGIQVDRMDYLSKAFSLYGDVSALDRKRPIDVFDKQIVTKIADDAINGQTRTVTAISTLAGIPGGLAMMASIPADLAQYYYHVLVIAQKLCYIYGWPDLRDENGEIGEGARGVLTIFVGVMLGAQAANKVVGDLAKRFAGQVARRLPQQALTKGFIYPIVKQIAKWIGVKMTKDIFAKGLSKAIPIIGGVSSGAITFATFKPMAKKLQKELGKEMNLHKSIDDDFYFESCEAEEQEQQEDTQAKQNLSLEYVKVQACINIAKIDSDFTEKETAYLTDLIDQAELTPEEKASLLNSLKYKELNDIDFKQYRGNSLFVSSLLDSLIEIIYIDGIVAPSEKIYLFIIAQALGVDRDMVNDLLESYGQNEPGAAEARVEMDEK